MSLNDLETPGINKNTLETANHFITNNRSIKRVSLFDSSGNAVDVIQGEFKPSGLNTGGLITKVELVDSEWRALPTNPLADRNAIAIQNNSGVSVLINYSNTAPSDEGITIANTAERFYDITDSIVIYGRSVSGTINIFIEEIS